MPVVETTYAAALFQAAQADDCLEAVRGELAEFVGAMRDVPELAALLRNPQFEPRAKIAVLREVLADGDELVRNFLLLLTEKGRSGEIEVVAAEFERLYSREQGVLDVELTTALELPEDEAAAIVRKIEEASGRPVRATRKVDSELVGGVVLQAGSLRLDASVRGRLNQLRRSLVSRS